MYSKNIGKIFSKQDQENMLNSTIGVIGVGGVGGYVAEFLCRIGCKKLIIFDGDVFNISNLNRQLFSTASNIGENKAVEAKKRLLSINPNQKIEIFDQDVENNDFCIEKLSECNLIFSCGIPYEKNPISIKQLFYILIFTKGIPIINGGITVEGIACASFISGKDLKYFNYIFDNYITNATQNLKEPSSVSSLSYLVALAASLEVNLGVKFICNKELIKDKTIKYNCIYNYSF